MAKRTYADKLRDPRWQRKRLEVFSRDKFTCIQCGSDKNELNVHHKFYDGREPWEYELSVLETLCRSCHEKHHNKPPEEKEYIGLLKTQIHLLRRMVPNTWNPNTSWIEERIDQMNIRLNNALNNTDRNG